MATRSDRELEASIDAREVSEPLGGDRGVGDAESGHAALAVARVLTPFASGRPSLSAADLLMIQRTAGNAAVGQLLRQTEPTQASMAVGGMPALRYNLPNIPIADAVVETPTATIEAQLLLRGNLTAVLGEQLPGASIDQSGWREEVTNQVNGIGAGLRISGLPDNPSIGTTEGNQFNLFETRFTPPNTVSFIGQARIALPSLQTQVGTVRVTGQPGCELRLTIRPKDQQNQASVPVPVPVPVPVTSPERSWWSEHAEEIGVVALAVVAIGGLVAITVLTEGAAAPATAPAIAEEAALLGTAAAALAQ
jgi:hypothetical protein